MIPPGSCATFCSKGATAESTPGGRCLKTASSKPWPEFDRWLESGSVGAARADALGGQGQPALDQRLGFLDLLARPQIGRPLPLSIAQRLPEELPEALANRWGIEASYCGAIAEDEWDSYPERALIVSALLEKSEISEGAALGREGAVGARL